MNLTEATMLALQGKLEEKKNPLKKPFKKMNTKSIKESLDVSVDEGVTVVQDEEKTVVVADNTNVTIDEEPIANTDEIVPETPESIEVPIDSDDTIIPEDEVPVETLPEETDDTNLEEPANLEEESKEIKTESIAQEGNATFALKIECTNDAFGGVSEDGEGNQAEMQAEVARILNEIADKVANGDYSNDSTILDKNGNKVGKYGFGFEGVQDPFTESKEIKTEEAEIEEEPADQIEDTEEVVEEKPTAEWSDNEIAEYIANHFKEVTGVELEEIFNQDTSEDAPIFNQDIIDATADEIFNFIDALDFDEKRKDNFIYILDDILSSKRLNNSEEDEATNKEDLDESKKVCESKIVYTYEVFVEGEQPTMFTDDTSVNDAKKQYITDYDGKGYDISDVKVHYFEKPVEKVIEESKEACANCGKSVEAYVDKK